MAAEHGLRPTTAVDAVALAGSAAVGIALDRLDVTARFIGDSDADVGKGKDHDVSGEDLAGGLE